MNDKQIKKDIQKLSQKTNRKIIFLKKTPSTNQEAKKQAKIGEPEGTIIVAQKQTQGRGRQQRTWESPTGGLYFSIILKPNIQPEKTTILPLLASLALSNTINQNYSVESTIKWPNDVLINNKKIAGILLESESTEKQINYIILGIGINLNNKLSKDLQKIATTLATEIKKEINTIDFLEKLIQTLDYYYTLFTNKEYTKILCEWKQNSDTIGKQVIIKTKTKNITGEAVDINEFGFLKIKTSTAQIITITSGDCVY